MKDAQRNEVSRKLTLAKDALLHKQQLSAVKEAIKSIDEAIKELYSDKDYVYEPPVKKPIEFHSDLELITELQKRLSERHPPAMA